MTWRCQWANRLESIEFKHILSYLIQGALTPTLSQNMSDQSVTMMKQTLCLWRKVCCVTCCSKGASSDSSAVEPNRNIQLPRRLQAEPPTSVWDWVSTFVRVKLDLLYDNTGVFNKTRHLPSMVIRWCTESQIRMFSNSDWVFLCLNRIRAEPKCSDERGINKRSVLAYLWFCRNVT